MPFSRSAIRSSMSSKFLVAAASCVERKGDTMSVRYGVARSSRANPTQPICQHQNIRAPRHPRNEQPLQGTLQADGPAEGPEQKARSKRRSPVDTRYDLVVTDTTYQGSPLPECTSRRPRPCRATSNPAFAQIAAKAGLRHVIRLEEARVDMRVIPLAHHELHHGQIELV